MSINDEATRDAIKVEFEKAFSPRAVRIEWDFGDLLYQIEGLKHSKLPRTEVHWNSVMTILQTIRGDLRRSGVKLQDWAPPPAPPTLS
jgi:hypothetical protein